MNQIERIKAAVASSWERMKRLLFGEKSQVTVTRATNSSPVSEPPSNTQSDSISSTEHSADLVSGKNDETSKLSANDESSSESAKPSKSEPNDHEGQNKQTTNDQTTSNSDEDESSAESADGVIDDGIKGTTEEAEPPITEALDDPTKLSNDENSKEFDDFEPNDKTTEKQRSSPRAPRRFRGRRRLTGAHSQPTRNPLHTSRPKLICQKEPKTAEWELFLVAENECQVERVHIDGKDVDFTDRKCLVPSMTSAITYTLQDEQEPTEILLDGSPLVFQFRKNWNDDGREVARLRKGYFIVIAPANWERIGNDPVEPESFKDPEYRAFYFYLDEDSMNEENYGFNEWDGGRANAEIDLIGQQIVYDDWGDGKLYVGSPPDLNLPSKIEWIRVGDELRRGWGENYEPQKSTLPEILENREGSFYIRIYEEDNPGRRSDSAMFRYVRDLDRIEINGEEYSEDTVLLPDYDGYSNTEIHLIGRNGVNFNPKLSKSSSEAGTNLDARGVIKVPPHPDADHVSFNILSPDQPAIIEIELPRIWWRLEGDDSTSNVWNHTPIEMTQKKFKELARDGVELLLLSKRHESVSVGFGDNLDRPHRRNLADKEIRIPLIPFVDYAEFDQELNTNLHFNVNWIGNIVPLIVIRPQTEIESIEEPLTKETEEENIEQDAQFTNESVVTPEPDSGVIEESESATSNSKSTSPVSSSDKDFTRRSDTVAAGALPSVDESRAISLIAFVKTPHGGWRKGKGFSTGELVAAGLNLEIAKASGVSTDSRRRSTHKCNVTALRSVINA